MEELTGASGLEARQPEAVVWFEMRLEEAVVKSEPSDPAGGDVKWYRGRREQSGSPSKV